MNPIGASELPTFCTLWNAIWPSQARDVEEILRIDQATTEGIAPARWLAAVNGSAVGFAEAHPLIGGAPGRSEISVGVLPGHRHQGLGRDLFKAAWTHLANQGAATTRTQVREGDAPSMDFALRRGFVEAKRDFESLLDLNQVDEEFLRELSESCPPNIRISTLKELDTPQFRRDFHDLFEEVRKDVPRTDPPEPLSFDFFDKVVLADPAFLWEGTLVATHEGRPIAFCGVFRGNNDGWVDQWLTAVRREWRRQSIARALKGRMLRWAKDAGYQTVRTDNDSNNVGMLSINDQIGFQRQLALITLRANVTPENQADKALQTG